MKKILYAFVIFSLFVTACDYGDEKVLISKKFIDDDTYEIVVKGFPKGSLTGVARVESSKRAALLNAYYFTRGTFGNNVIPDKEGSAEEFKVKSDYAVVTYVIKKKNLKNLQK